MFFWIDGGLFWEIPVHSVECSRQNDVTEVALMLQIDQEEDLELLGDLCSAGTVLDVVHTPS